MGVNVPWDSELGRRLATEHGLTPPKRKGKRNNKYNAQTTIIDGIRFDSKREAMRYGELKLLECTGQIQNLKTHVRFPLHISGHLLTTYEADFVYLENGVRVIEDVKGVRTREYRKKKKHMKIEYGIDIRET